MTYTFTNVRKQKVVWNLRKIDFCFKEFNMFQQIIGSFKKQPKMLGQYSAVVNGQWNYFRASRIIPMVRQSTWCLVHDGAFNGWRKCRCLITWWWWDMTNISLDDSGQTALCSALNGGVVKNSRFQVLCRSQPEKKNQHNRSIKENRFWKFIIQINYCDNYTFA